MPILIASANITNYLDTKESVTQPTNPVEGQKWRDESQTPPILKVYKNGAWINYETSLKEQDPNLWDELQTEVNAAKQAGIEAKAAGERAEQLGNEAKQVGEEAKQAGEDAKAEAELAKQAGEEAKAAGQRAESLAGQAKTESATAITNANNAVSKANQAVEDAGFSKTLAQDAQQLADEAKQDALNAVSQSDTAKQIAESASSAASGAVTTANQAKQDAINAVGQAGTAVTDAKAALDAYNNMEVGGRNLLKGTGDMSENIQAGTVDTTETLSGNNSVKRSFVSGSADTYGGITTIPVNGTEYTITFWAKADRTIGFRNYFYLPDTTTKVVSSSGETNTNNNGETYFTATTEWKKYWITWTQTPTTEIKRILLGRLSSEGTIWINSPMLVEGNVPMPWTPAPEDVQTQITSINGELSQKVSQNTFNTLQGTVSNQGTQINQNKSDIALKANQSTVNTLTGRVSTAEGQITAQAGQIAQRLTSAQVESLVNGKGYATQTSVNSQVSTINNKLNEHTSQLQTVTATVDGMQFGGRNLLIGTKDWSGTGSANNGWSTVLDTLYDGNRVLEGKPNPSTASLYTDLVSYRTSKELVGTEYTVSFWMKATKVGGVNCFFYNPNTTTNAVTSQGFTSSAVDGGIAIAVNTVWTKYWIKWKQTPTTSPKSLIIGRMDRNDWVGHSVQISSLMLSEGNTVVPWTPAPEDTATVAELTSKTNAINQRITDTENSITAVVNTTSTQGGKISSLESRVSVAEGSITTTNTKVTNNSTEIGNLKTSYSGLQSTVSAVRNDLDGLNFGLRNLIQNSGGNPSAVNPWSGTGTGTVSLVKHSFYKNGQENIFCLMTSDSSETTLSSNYFKIKRNTTYTLKFTGFASSNVNSMDVFFLSRTVGSENNFDRAKILIQGARLSPSQAESRTITFTTQNNDDAACIRFDNNGSSNGLSSSLYFTDVTLVEGNKAPVDWFPAWEDTTSVTQFSDFKQDVNGFKQTVSSTYAKQTALNTVSQTVNSTTQTIATMQTDLNGKATVTALNSVKDTVDSHTQTISSHNGRITTAQQTADGAKTTAADAQGRVATVEQKVTGLQTTVADKADKSQITQLSGQITSVVQAMDNIGTENIFPFASAKYANSNGNWLGTGGDLLTVTHDFYMKNQEPIWVLRNTGTSEVYRRTKWFSIQSGTKYTVKFWGFNNGTLSSFDLYVMYRTTGGDETDGPFEGFVSQTGKLLSSSRLDSFEFTFETGSNWREIYVRIDNNGRLTSSPNNSADLYFTNFMLVEGEVAPSSYNLPVSYYASKSQITQLSDQIDLRVTKGDLIGEINVRAGKTIIRQSDNVLMVTPTTTYIQDATIKNAHIADLAVTNAKIGNLAVSEGKIADASITTLKVADAAISNAKIANLAVDGAKIASLAVDTGHIKDLAVSNAKIANLAVSNAKIADAAITSAKIGDAAIVNAKIANGAINDAKIQDASISSAKIISLDANKISANDLRSISSQTGALEVTGWLDFSSDNRGVRGSYNFGDDYIGAYNSRWFDGDFRMSHRYLMFKSQVYDVTSNNTRGAYRYHTESFYGPDYLKLRQYSSSSMSTLLNHVDITADSIIIGDRDWATRAQINADGTAMFNGRVRFNSGIDIGAPDNIGLSVGRINAPDNYQSLTINQNRALSDVVFGEQNIYFNETRTIAADFRIGRDGSNINGGRVVASNAIYNRTYSGAANMFITPEGVLGRSTSALKYKDDVRTANDVMSKAKKVIQLQPKSWLDKGELADGIANKRHYGFIADEFDALGLSEVVIYGDKGQVESLAYDRISMYHNVILKEHEAEIQSMKYGNFERDVELQKLKFEIQRLNMEIESLRQSA